MAFTNEQLERYSRHIILKEIGVKGQKKLLNAKVLIIGAGGLGAPAALYLAAAGVGTIGIADADVVDLSNLQRQVIHTTGDVGKRKVDSAAETMRAINPDVTVNTYYEFVNSANIMDLIKDYPLQGAAYYNPAWRGALLPLHFQESAAKRCSADLPSGRRDRCSGRGHRLPSGAGSREIYYLGR